MGARRAALREMTLTRLRVMLREPEVVFWVFLFPVLLALGLGVAFSDPTPERVRVALVGFSDGIAGRVGAGAEAPGGAPRDPTAPDFRVMAPDEAARALARGTVSLVATARGDSLIYRYDPTRPEAWTALLATDAALQAEAGAGPVRPARREEVRERGGRYIDWLIPGLIGFNLMSTGLWAVGFYLTQLRATRQLKRLVATPMRRGDFLLAQMLARLVFLVAEVPLLVVFAWLAFGVTVEGSLPALVAVVLLGGATFAGVGLLAASRARTVEGVSGIINVIVMPMVVLSGVFFSTARFPDAIQPLIRLLPLTALNDALRAVYNEGAGLAGVAGELALVGAWGLAAFLVALRLFRWQ